MHSQAMIQPEYFFRNTGVDRVGLTSRCSRVPGRASVQTEHQVRARKKKEKKSRGQPITQLRVMPMFFSGSSGPKNRVNTATSRTMLTTALGRAG